MGWFMYPQTSSNLSTVLKVKYHWSVVVVVVVVVVVYGEAPGPLSIVVVVYRGGTRMNFQLLKEKYLMSWSGMMVKAGQR